MGKYTKYTSNYPTQYSNWMYPPKNFGLFKYMTLAAKGYWKAHAPAIPYFWSYGVMFVPVTYIMYKITKASKGTEFAKSIRSHKGNWLYGPPSEKRMAQHHEHEVLSAPDK